MAIHELADPTFELPVEAIPYSVKEGDTVTNDQRTTVLACGDSPFSEEELERFKADDAAVAGAIGKILATLFIYTAIIMSIVIWWTLKTVWNW